MTVHQLCVAVNVLLLELIKKQFTDNLRQIYGLNSNRFLKDVVALRKTRSPKYLQPFRLRVPISDSGKESLKYLRCATPLTTPGFVTWKITLISSIECIITNNLVV